MHSEQPKSTPRSNQAFQRLWSIHWVMATCFLAIYSVGIVMARLPREVSFRGSLYNFHKSMGVLILVLLLVRVFTLLQVFGKKYLKRKPRLTQAWITATALHSLLYLFMLIIPISGIWFSNAGGHPIPFFWITLPNLFEANRAIAQTAESLHFWLAYTLLALLALHLVEQQKFLKRTWNRMTKQT